MIPTHMFLQLHVDIRSFPRFSGNVYIHVEMTPEDQLFSRDEGTNGFDGGKLPSAKSRSSRKRCERALAFLILFSRIVPIQTRRNLSEPTLRSCTRDSVSLQVWLDFARMNGASDGDAVVALEQKLLARPRERTNERTGRQAAGQPRGMVNGWVSERASERAC